LGKDWKSKMYVKIQAEDGQFLLSPITEINPTFNTPHVQEHSLEADNVGVTKQNDTFAFSLAVKAVRDDESGTNPSKNMTLLQLNHKPFQVVLQERKTQDSDGKNWAFEESILLEECYVNNSSPTRAILNGSPNAVFNCISMGVTVDGDHYDGTLP